MLFDIFRIREKEAFTERIFTFIEHPVDCLQPQVAHSLVVGVRIDQGNSQTPTPRVGFAACFLLMTLTIFFNQVT